MVEHIVNRQEVLSNGLASPREVGGYLIDLAREAEAIEEEVGFGYETGGHNG